MNRLESFGARLEGSGATPTLFGCVAVSGCALLCIKNFGTNILNWAQNQTLPSMNPSPPALMASSVVLIATGIYLLKDVKLPTPFKEEITITSPPSEVPAPTHYLGTHPYEKEVKCPDRRVYNIKLYGKPGLDEKEQAELFKLFIDKMLTKSVEGSTLKPGDQFDLEVDQKGCCSSNRTHTVQLEVSVLEKLKKFKSNTPS